MITTTLLLTLASLGAVPAGPVRLASVAVLERHAIAADLYVPTGVAVPVKGLGDGLRSGELFGHRVVEGGDAGVATAPRTDDATLQGVMVLPSATLPICRF